MAAGEGLFVDALVVAGLFISGLVVEELIVGIADDFVVLVDCTLEDCCSADFEREILGCTGCCD